MVYSAWTYIDLVQAKKESLAKLNYEAQALGMQKRVSSLILAKQKATAAMALSLSNDQHLAQNILDNKIDENYYKDLILKFKKNTHYQNIWIQILDKNLISIYRSWTDKSGDNIANLRKDLVEVIKTKKVRYTISSGKFDLSIKAIVPILKDKEIVGIFEIISHFNSISKQMKKFDIDSVVVLDKKFTKELKYPFTKLFIDDYYIANFDAPLSLRKDIQKGKITNYFNSTYSIKNGHIVTAYELKSLSNETLGFYIMFKNLNNISSAELDFFTFKWLVYGIIIIMIIAGIVNITMFYLMRKQKIYYRKIIDSSTNIVVINKKRDILDVNKVFFKYFNKYSSLNEFKKEYNCICDFFVGENSYIQKELDGIYWLDYLLKNNEKSHKVKIKYFDDIYYFSVSASTVSDEKDYYSAVFTDITKEENYKHELEHISVTDALTKIKNRHFFQERIKSEMARSNRYNYTFSIIMIDIDFFKKVNDEHGHDVGDRILIEYTKLIASILRDSDKFCRVGGEEFIVILPHTATEPAMIIAEKLRKAVENYKKVLPITISCGVTEYVVNEHVDFLLKRVDNALYEAKDSGRNMVISK